MGTNESVEHSASKRGSCVAHSGHYNTNAWQHDTGSEQFAVSAMNDINLDHFPILRLRAVWHVVEDLYLVGYLGGTLRGAFGHALRQTACASVREDDCARCSARSRCVYFRLFRTSELNPLHGARGRSTPPSPLVIEPPEAPRRPLERGDEIHMGVVLVGDSIADLPSVVKACELMGKIGLGQRGARLQLQHVDFVHARGYAVAYAPEDTPATMPPFEPTLGALAPRSVGEGRGRLEITLVTPLRLKRGGKLLSDVDFQVLVTHAVQRIRLLDQLHTGAPYLADGEAVEAAAAQCRTTGKRLRWWDWATDSRSQGRIRLGGLMGVISVEGSWQPLLPILRLAEQIHVGKNTTYGLGKISLRGT